MTAHTPGPWRVSTATPTKTRGIDVLAGDRFVAHCVFSHLAIYKGEPERRARADASLIAAAPDMLDLARNCAGVDDGWLAHTDIRSLRAAITEYRDAARAIIAKAEGSQ